MQEVSDDYRVLNENIEERPSLSLPAKSILASFLNYK